MKHTLVTGGLGFIGHNVVQILEQVQQVVVLDSETNYGFIPQAEMDYLIGERREKFHSQSYCVDIRNQLTTDAFIRDCDVDTIVHLASFPRQKVVSTDPAYASEVMTTGLINLLESAKKHNVRKFVYISSSMVYGDFENDVTEDSPCNPVGQYGIMKYLGEKLVEDYARRTGMQYVIIRPSAVYGESDVEDRVVSKFMLGAMRGEVLKVKGAGEVLDFSYVGDTARGIAMAAVKDEANNKIYNITKSDPKLWTLSDAAELAIKIAGKGSIKYMDKDAEFPTRGRLSIERARADFGYDPKVTVEEGFFKYYNWFKASPYWSKRL
jgi:nucleoside-diphosphate-sugar epimerase